MKKYDLLLGSKITSYWLLVKKRTFLEQPVLDLNSCSSLDIDYQGMAVPDYWYGTIPAPGSTTSYYDRNYGIRFFLKRFGTFG